MTGHATDNMFWVTSPKRPPRGGWAATPSYGQFQEHRTIDGYDIASRCGDDFVVTTTADAVCDNLGWRLEMYCWISPHSGLACMSWNLVKHGRSYCSIDYPVEHAEGGWDNIHHAVLDAQERVSRWALWIRGGKYRSFRHPDHLPWH